LLFQFLIPVIVVPELVHLAVLLMLRLLVLLFGLIVIVVVFITMVVTIEESLHEAFLVLGLCFWKIISLGTWSMVTGVAYPEAC